MKIDDKTRDALLGFLEVYSVEFEEFLVEEKDFDEDGASACLVDLLEELRED